MSLDPAITLISPARNEGPFRTPPPVSHTIGHFLAGFSRKKRPRRFRQGLQFVSATT